MMEIDTCDIRKIYRGKSESIPTIGRNLYNFKNGDVIWIESKLNRFYIAIDSYHYYKIKQLILDLRKANPKISIEDNI